MSTKAKCLLGSDLLAALSSALPASVSHALSSLPDPLLALSSSSPATTTTTVLSLLAFQLLINVIRNKPYTSPYPTSAYDAVSAAAYFSTRPFTQVSRALEILLTSSSFILTLLDDSFLSRPESTYEFDCRRGTELAALLTRLGPTFIKVGQSLSTRSDILSGGYCAGLASLQDAVEPFPTREAFRSIEKSLGIDDIRDVFEEISPEPVASAR